MDAKEFIEQLNQVRKLMIRENYIDALEILENLKNIERTNEESLSYDLTHQLYQLDSNCKSAFQQQVILTHLNKISRRKNSISFKELNQDLKNKNKLDISETILRREIELLILRNLLSCELKGNLLIFSSP
jgi:hypothetical protein